VPKFAGQLFPTGYQLKYTITTRGREERLQSRLRRLLRPVFAMTPPLQFRSERCFLDSVIPDSLL
jgi:hypothetical protein